MIRHALKTMLLALSLVAMPAFAKSAQMEPAADQNPQPEAGKALVVFLRPSFYGGAISSSVYDAPDGSTTFLGIVQYKNKLAAQMTPGQHRLMVVSENADFLDAQLEAGKTYYVLVSPRPGVWKARFSLLPIHNDSGAERNVQSKDFAEWQQKTHFVQMSPEAQAWYESNRANIESKKADYLEKWNRMLPQDRAQLVLRAEDGIAASP